MQRGRLAVVGALGFAAVAAAVAIAQEATVPAAPPPSPIDTALAAGTQLRIDGPRGPIHVWIPAGYEADTAATIVYVHGYWDTADTAWTTHQLPQQFALSALNAMFIVPEAPNRQRVPVNYPDLTELIRIVEDATRLPRGATLTVAIGHSGAWRTLETWLDEPLLDTLVMVDAAYGDEDPIVAWANASPRHRLIVVGQDTVLGTEAIVDRLAEKLEVVTLDRFPPSYELWPTEAKAARVVNVRAQYGHMALVNAGVVLPSLLRQLPVARLADLPWQLPLGSLPPYDASVGDAGTRR